MKSSSSIKSFRNLIRLSLLLLILPVLYLGFWFSISTDESLTYFEQVQMLMSYFPEAMRNPYWISFTFFGMSLGSAILSFSAYQKSSEKNTQAFSMILCVLGVLLTTWFGMALF